MLFVLTFPVLAAGQTTTRPGQDGAAKKTPTTQPGLKAAVTPGLSDEGMQDLELLNLEVPTVVTAARREQRITSVPYAMTVITAEDIRRSGARTVTDALRLAPGVDVADLGWNEPGISPRGWHGAFSRTVLILMDGRQMYDSVWGGALLGTWPFQLEDIDQIEVIRGPGGVTWGSNAVDGVINIITKDPKDQQGVTTTAGGGSPGQHKEHVGYGFSEDKLRMRVSGEYESGRGFTKGGSFLRGLNDEFESERMAIHGIYEASPKDKFTFSGGSNYLDHGYSLSVTDGFLPWDVNHPYGQASYMLGKWKHAVAPDNAFEVTGYVNDFSLHLGNAAIDYRYQQLALQIGHTFKPADEHTLTWGFDTRTDIIDTSNGFCLTQNFIGNAIVGPYIQDEWKFAPRWTLNLGARLDYDFYGGFQPSARAALSYDLAENQSVYGAVSRAFQMPAVGLRFLDVPMLDGLAWVTSNRNESPEILIAYELGYRGKFFDKLQTSLNVYFNTYDDVTVLSPSLGPPGLIHYYDDDSASASSYGVEWEGRYAVTRQFTLRGNYTYEQLNWNSADPLVNKDLMTPPKHKFMIGAQYDPVEDLHLSSFLYYVDAVQAPNSVIPFFPLHVPPYFRWDLRAEYDFWKKQASVAVGVRDLIDPNHPEGGSLFVNKAEVPRMVYAEIRVHFDK